ncbi:MAG: PadR family transcriptional regulator [Gemmatimonadota bacterium]|jgi:transcriptional regulator
MHRTPQDLLPGSLDALILKGLQGEARHGYAISRWVRERTQGIIEVEDAALYKALGRMTDRGWVTSEWGVSDRGRRAKFYQLTDSGRRALEAETRTWKVFSLAVNRVLDTG